MVSLPAATPVPSGYDHYGYNKAGVYKFETVASTSAQKP
jgi:hypothetical protein